MPEPLAAPAEAGVPCALGARTADTREATRDLWGDAAVEAVHAALPPDARPFFAPGAAPPPWVPERAFVDYMHALWEGPAGRQREALARWAARINERGFGTASRLLLALASPWLVLRRSQALWRAEHTHGTLRATPTGPRGAVLTLAGHPFAEDAVARDAISEALRCIILRCRVREVSESHRPLTGGELEVTLDWR